MVKRNSSNTFIHKHGNNSLGMLQYLRVFTQGGGALIGSGWVIHKNRYQQDVTLISLDGKELPEDWYTLQIVDEGRLVVINGSIH